MKGSVFFVVLKMICGISRYNCLVGVNSKEKNKNVCFLRSPSCFLKLPLYFEDSFWHVLLWKWLTSSVVIRR